MIFLAEIIFQTPVWYVLFCLLLGAAYAYFLYKPKPSWSREINWLLAALRGTLISIIAFLLLNPLLRSVQTLVDKPKAIIAIDNSLSLAAYGSKYLQQLNTLAETLADKGLDVTIQTLTEAEATIKDVKFDQNATNLSELLQSIKNNFEGRNLSEVVLFSDGISNQGIAPTSLNFPFRIHTVAVGDTTPKRDVSVKAVVANKIAYLENKFPIQADISAYGYAGQTALVILKNAGQELGRQTVTFGQPDAFAQVLFQTESKQKGVQHYTVEVNPLKGEFTTRNNRQDVYIDIVDGKEKVLLLALAPHPDVKALRAILEKNINFEVDTRIFGLNPTPGDYLQQKYDLIILHQLPDYFNTGAGIIKQLLARDNTPVMFVLANQSSAMTVSQMNNALAINAGAGQIDQVSGRFNTNFKLLNLDADNLSRLEAMPPLSVPFGDYRALSGTEVILYQNVGSVKTNRPLLAINTGGTRKTAVLAGEGIWQWRMNEYAETETQMAVDELFMKTIQLISVKDDKRKFRVYPLKNEYNLGDEVGFGTEVYNDIYEKTYGQNVSISIKNESGKTQSYSYQNAQDANVFKLSNLGQGVYSYKASTMANNKNEAVEGQFIVRDLALEATNLTADFAQLKALSDMTGGQFSVGLQADALVNKIIANKPKDRLDSTEDLASLLDNKWLFFLLLMLVALEWGIRKFQGNY